MPSVRSLEQKEDLDRQSHSPTRSPTVDQQQSRHLARANARNKMSDAEAEIQRLKRELDKAVQVRLPCHSLIEESWAR